MVSILLTGGAPAQRGSRSSCNSQPTNRLLHDLDNHCSFPRSARPFNQASKPLVRRLRPPCTISARVTLVTPCCYHRFPRPLLYRHFAHACNLPSWQNFIVGLAHRQAIMANCRVSSECICGGMVPRSAVVGTTLARRAVRESRLFACEVQWPYLLSNLEQDPQATLSS